MMRLSPNKRIIVKKFLEKFEKDNEFPADFDDYHLVKNVIINDAYMFDDEYMFFYNNKTDKLLELDTSDQLVVIDLYTIETMDTIYACETKNKTYFLLEDDYEFPASIIFFKEYVKNHGINITLKELTNSECESLGEFRYKVKFKNKADEAYFQVIMNDYITPYDNS